MLERLIKRLRDHEEGFTLIELMVVVLIIAILIAIAIPTFLGARARAQDRAAQSNIRNTFTAEKTYYTDKQAYTATASDLTAIEPSLTYGADSGVSTGSTNFVGVSVSGNVVVLGAKSASGKCFWLRDDPSAGTTYLKQDTCSTSAPTSGFAATGWQ